MATTTNFGWETPDDTDLVKDGAAAIRTLGQSIDTSMADLEGGTTGQVLAKNSNTDMDFIWTNGGDITGVTAGVGISGGGTSGAVTVTNSMATAITTAGDLIKGTGSGTFDRLGIGTTGQVLTVASGAPSWASPSAAAFSGCSIYNSADVSLTSGTATAITCDSEFYDTDGFHSISSNTSRITIPSGKGGYYLIQGYMQYASNATGNRTTSIRKNGSTILLQNLNSVQPEASRSMNIAIAYVGNFAVADYVELFGVQNSGGALTVQMVPSYTFHFSATYLGA
jgi:hypothetical protein